MPGTGARRSSAAARAGAAPTAACAGRGGAAATAGRAPRSRGSGSRTRSSARARRPARSRPRRDPGSADRRSAARHRRQTAARCRRRCTADGSGSRARPRAACASTSDHGAWIAAAERRQDAHAHVAELVAEPLDRDRAIGRHRAGRRALIGDVADEVVGGVRVEVVLGAQPRARVRRIAWRAADRARGRTRRAHGRARSAGPDLRRARTASCRARPAPA